MRLSLLLGAGSLGVLLVVSACSSGTLGSGASDDSAGDGASDTGATGNVGTGGQSSGMAGKGGGMIGQAGKGGGMIGQAGKGGATIGQAGKGGSMSIGHGGTQGSDGASGKAMGGAGQSGGMGGTGGDPCDGVTCNSHGTCASDGMKAQCNCDSGYQAAGLTCSAGTEPTNRVQRPIAGAQPGNWDYHEVGGQHVGVLLPQNYDPSLIYPVVLFLHFNGIGTDWYVQQLDSVRQDEGDPYFNTEGVRTNYPWIVLMPYCDQSQDNAGGADINWGGYTQGLQFSETANMALMQWAFQQYAVDHSRLYVTGTSLGGHGAYGHMFRYNLQTGMDKQHRYFVAGAPCDGWSLDFFPNYGTLQEDMRNVPMWLSAGNQDGSASPFARSWIEAYGGSANGGKAPNGNWTYNEYDGGHGSGWNNAYALDGNGHAPAFEFLWANVATPEQMAASGQ